MCASGRASEQVFDSYRKNAIAQKPGRPRFLCQIAVFAGQMARPGSPTARPYRQIAVDANIVQF